MIPLIIILIILASLSTSIMVYSFIKAIINEWNKSHELNESDEDKFFTNPFDDLDNPFS